MHLWLTLEGGPWVIAAVGWKVQILRRAWEFSICLWWLLANDWCRSFKAPLLAHKCKNSDNAYTLQFPLWATLHGFLPKIAPLDDILFYPILFSHSLTRIFWEHFLRKSVIQRQLSQGLLLGNPTKTDDDPPPPIIWPHCGFLYYITLSSIHLVRLSLQQWKEWTFK